MDNNSINDADIRALFNAYRQTPSSDTDFMRRLEQKMDAIEYIRRRNTCTVRRYRRAMVAAAIAGFVSGAVFTMAVPYIEHIIQKTLQFIDLPHGVGQNLAWIAVTVLSALAAFVTYDLMTPTTATDKN